MSPAISLPKGEKYEISFQVYTTYYDTEHLNVTIGTASEPEAQTAILKSVDIKGAYYNAFKVSVIIPALAEQAITDVCTPGNPREVSKDDIIALYHKIL